MERNIIIRHNGEELTASIHYPSGGKGGTGRCKDRVPLAVICHGFVGNRIGVDRIFVKAARELAADGYMVIRFDYAGCGESSGNYGSENMRASASAGSRASPRWRSVCARSAESRQRIMGC